MLKFLALDRFTILLFVMVLLASVLPVSGQAAGVFGWVTTGAIAILFLHGAKLSREAVVEGIMHWRLHTLVFALTFVMFPILGLLAKPILLPMLGQELYWGFLFMCFLPSTVQSSIAFTSVAHGNVAGAVCSASFPILLECLLLLSWWHFLFLVNLNMILTRPPRLSRLHCYYWCRLFLGRCCVPGFILT